MVRYNYYDTRTIVFNNLKMRPYYTKILFKCRFHLEYPEYASPILYIKSDPDTRFHSYPIYDIARF